MYFPTSFNDFGEVTDLVTNVQNTMVVPIRLTLKSLSLGFPYLGSNLPIHYLGLLLLIHQLRSGDFQFTVDKMASKLPIGQEKYVTPAGRASLIKSVIAPKLFYSLTVLALPKGIFKAIFKLDRTILWVVSDKVSGGKMQSKMGRVLFSQEHVRSWFLYLDKFGRSLRLRWP
jgi:hypothetical protein